MSKKEKDTAYQKHDDSEQMDLLWRLRDDAMWKEEMLPTIQRKIENGIQLSRSDEMNIHQYGEFQGKQKLFAKHAPGGQQNQTSNLSVSQPDDVHEKEADVVAKKVVGGESADVNGTVTTINRKGEGAGEVTSEFQTKLEGSKANGQSLPENVQQDIGGKMGADLSGVKIHTGGEANNMSENINAKAFTHEQDIYFKEGNYNPESKDGKELLAHELTHTVQQGSGKIQPKIQRQAIDNDKEADSLIKANTSGKLIDRVKLGEALIPYVRNKNYDLVRIVLNKLSSDIDKAAVVSVFYSELTIDDKAALDKSFFFEIYEIVKKVTQESNPYTAYIQIAFVLTLNNMKSKAAKENIALSVREWNVELTDKDSKKKHTPNSIVLAKGIADLIEGNRAKVPDNSKDLKAVTGGWQYYGKNPKDQNSNDLLPKDMRSDSGNSNIIQQIYKVISNEVDVGEAKLSGIVTYDDQIFSWGKGFAGGATVAPIISFLFKTDLKNNNHKYSDRFLDVGIYVNNGQLVIVNTIQGPNYGRIVEPIGNDQTNILKIIAADTRLLSFFIDLSENKDTAPDVLDAQWEQLKTGAAKIPPYVHDGKDNYKDEWSDEAVALTAHLTHWLPAGGWASNSYENTKGNIRKIVTNFFLLLNMKNTYLLDTAKKKHYLAPSDATSGAIIAGTYADFKTHLSSFGVGANHRGVGWDAVTKASDLHDISSDIISSAGFKDYILIPSGADKYYALSKDMNLDPTTANTDFNAALTKAINDKKNEPKKKSLDINQPNDPQEKEADDIAKKVVNSDTHIQRKTNSGSVMKFPEINRKEADEIFAEKNPWVKNSSPQNLLQNENTVMRKEDGGEMKTTDNFNTQLNNSKGSGQPLPENIHSEIGGKMGADFSDVKIHADSNAHKMSENINAKAFAHGQDIYFKDGHYNPESKDGKELLAHELVHTQQQKGDVQRKIQRAPVDDSNMDITTPVPFLSFVILDKNQKVVYTEKSYDGSVIGGFGGEVTVESIGDYTIKFTTRVGDISQQLKVTHTKFVLRISIKEDPIHSYLGKVFVISNDAPLYTITKGTDANTFTGINAVVGKSYDPTKSVIPINTEVSIVATGTHYEVQKGGGHKNIDVVEVADKNKLSLGWTSRANISKDVNASKFYTVISKQANIRSAPSDVTGPKTIPKGTKVMAKDVVRDNFSSRLVYALVVDGNTGTEYGWISSTSIEGKMIGETMRLRTPKFESTDQNSKTIGGKNATARVKKGVYYDEMMPMASNIIPEGSSVQILNNGAEFDNYPNTKVIQVQVMKVKNTKDNAWLQRPAFWITSSNKGEADGTYFKVKKGAVARRDAVTIFESNGTTMAQGSFVVKKETEQGATGKVQGKALTILPFTKVAYTKNDGTKTVEDPSITPVWTTADNFADGGWADFKSLNAMWKDGNYLGQTDALEIVGEKGEQRQLRPGTATDQFLLMAKKAKADNPSVILSVRSGFRDYPHQAKMYADYQAGTKAETTARPGYSQHQSGYAIDIDAQYGDAAYVWLQNNGPSFGFIRTVNGEPWHWEYLPDDVKKYNTWKKPGIS